MSKTTDYKVQWTPELRDAVDNRIIEYLQQGYSQQEAEEKALQDQLDHTTFIQPEVTVTAQAPVQKQVATESDWDPGYTKFMSGERYYADQDHKNYLDWQRNDYTRGIREATDKWGNAIGAGVEIASGFTPLWWVAPAVRTGLDLSEGNYKGAALNAGLAFAAPYAIGKGLQFITPHARTALNSYNRYRNIRNFTKELNKNISKTQIRQHDVLPLEDGVLFHNGHTEVKPAGFNGKKFTYIQREAKPGALKIQNGKYASVREPYGDNQDMLWWDTQGHNYGKEVYVTRQSDDAVNVMSNMRELPISQISERYQPNYYITKQKPVEQVIKYTYNPITGYTPSMPGTILTNRMSYDDILQQPVISSVKQSTPSKTSLAFFERQPAKISEAERLGISKGDRNQALAIKQQVDANTQKIIDFLNSNRRTVDGHNIYKGAKPVHNLRAFLQQNKVDVSKLSDQDLADLIALRQHALQTQSSSRYIVPGKSHVQLYAPGTKEAIGYADFGALDDMYTIDMVSNTTFVPGSTPVKGVSEDIMNFLIQESIKNGGKGVRSGHLLKSPQATTKIWNKYPDKEILSMTEGSHYWEPYTATPGPIVLLKSPSKEVVPSKSFLFSPNSITSDGQMIIDWNKGLYRKNGGKLNYLNYFD